MVKRQTGTVEKQQVEGKNLNRIFTLPMPCRTTFGTGQTSIDHLKLNAQLTLCLHFLILSEA